MGIHYAQNGIIMFLVAISHLCVWVGFCLFVCCFLILLLFVCFLSSKQCANTFTQLSIINSSLALPLQWSAQNLLVTLYDR